MVYGKTHMNCELNLLTTTKKTREDGCFYEVINTVYIHRHYIKQAQASNIVQPVYRQKVDRKGM